MYNRYIPQPDGSFRRDRMPEKRQQNESKKPCPPPTCPPAESIAPCPPQPPPPQVCQDPVPKPPPRRPHPPKEPGGIGNFFKRLLPKDLDTADLLIIILLLLMAGDKEEDQTNALLTLALYFFM